MLVPEFCEKLINSITFKMYLVISALACLEGTISDMFYIYISTETEPLCETNLSYSENSIFADGAGCWMRCSVNFNGNWAPTLEWRLHEGNGETEEPIDHTDRANVVTISNANISSSLTIVLNSTSKSSFYSCKVYFTSENNSQMVTANNTPDYKYEWKSPLVLSLPKTGIGLSPTQWKVVLLSKTVTLPTQWRGLTTATDTNGT